MKRRTFLGLVATLCLLLVVPDPTWAARQFNGSSDRGANSSSLAGVSAADAAFTISAWVYADSTSAGSHMVFLTGQAGGYSAQLRRDGSDWNFYVNRTVGVNVNATMVGGVTAGVWTHLAATYAGSSGNIKLYVGGTLQQTTALGGTRDKNGSSNHLGVELNDTSAFWDGRIAELAIWDSDIGAADIATLAAATTNDAALNKSLITTAAKEYWNLLGLVGPEPNGGDLANTFAWTMTGTSKLDSPLGVIFYVQGGKNTTAALTHASTLATTIPATVLGDTLVVAVENGDNPNPAATVSSVTGATFVKQGGVGNTSGSDSTNAEVWVARTVAAGITSITVNWSAVTVAVVTIGEYFGVKSLGRVVTATGTAANPTISLTTQDANNVAAAAISREGVGIGAFTGATAGRLRLKDAAVGDGVPDNAGGLIDTSSATPASVTMTATHAGTNPWAAVAVELRTGTTGRRVMQY